MSACWCVRHRDSALQGMQIRRKLQNVGWHDMYPLYLHSSSMFAGHEMHSLDTVLHTPKSIRVSQSWSSELLDAGLDTAPFFTCQSY